MRKTRYSISMNAEERRLALDALLHFRNKVLSQGIDNETICEDFNVLYAAMNGKSLREIDEILSPVCTLCRDHEKAGFEEGIKVGLRLAQEINL